MNTQRLSRKLSLLYFRYKDTPYYHISLYGVIILVCIILMVTLIIPEAKNWLSVQQEVEATRERIKVLNNNSQFLQSLNDQQLEADLLLASQALPPVRDISGLIEAINFSATNAGVGLEDFSFQGGDISVKPADQADLLSNAKVTFNARGDFSQTRRFLSEIQQKMPLLSLNEIEAQFQSSGVTIITLSYYYQPYPLIQEDYTQPLTALTPEQQLLLEKLRSWKIVLPDLLFPVATDGASMPPL